MLKIQKWLDKISVTISAIMLAAMMIILLANVILRYTPGVGGFKWYMESSQYLNVWAMMISGVAITIYGTHLRVELMDSLVSKSSIGTKIIKTINSLFIILFYLLAAYSGYQLATKAKQAVSTMPKFTMGQVYALLPVAFVFCALASVVDLIVFFQGGEKGEETE